MYVGPDDPIFSGRFPGCGGGRSGELAALPTLDYCTALSNAMLSVG